MFFKRNFKLIFHSVIEMINKFDDRDADKPHHERRIVPFNKEDQKVQCFHTRSYKLIAFCTFSKLQNSSEYFDFQNGQNQKWANMYEIL